MSRIRPTDPTETPALCALVEATGFFKPLEVVALREVLDDYHAANQALGHRSITYDHEGEVLGFAYFAPAAMTDRTWYLWWIAVAKTTQARGIGGILMRDVEAEIVRAAGRILLIETSSMPHYEPTRRFYEKHGYKREAVLRDYYADSDDLVIFRKRLLPFEGEQGTDADRS